MTDIPSLYKKYFIDKNDERKNMFEIINDLYKPQNGIYPGSFVHITPSFYVPNMTYIDSDKRINKFFTDLNIDSYIEENKVYIENFTIKHFQTNFNSKIDIKENDYDLMFSFYAGFISQSCKKYLKEGGLLVCNNSHGDSSLAFVDKDYTFIGVIKRNGNKFTFSDKKLSDYFIKKDGTKIDKDKVLLRMIGENFTKKAYAYVFKIH